MKRIYYTTGRRLGYRSFSRVEGADVIELKRLLHALGYWRPSLQAFPDAPPSTNTAKMQELRKSYEQAMAAARQASAAYNKEYALYDDEAIAAVDRFRADRKLNYASNPPGLVDQRFVDALKAAYLEKRKSGR
jgi:predicted DsbA family dithiol-disulfide isomerase